MVLKNAILFLVGWAFIIIVYGISKDKLDEFDRNEMVEDGNSLFKTGLAYTITTLLCYLFKPYWIKLVIFIFSAFFQIPVQLALPFKIFNRNVIFYRKLTLSISVIIPTIQLVLVFYKYIL